MRLRAATTFLVLKHLKYAADLGLKICFAAEDASRADFDFLVEYINKF
jgi:isopropylmalate/homocitrate/citramalate synthase